MATTADPAAMPPAQGAAQPWPSPRLAWYAVFVFSLSLLINFLDRGIVGLLVEPIKADLGLSDTQMGFILGFAFVTFYALLGLPIARLIDIGTRRTIFGVGIALWSVMTAACGLAGNFWQLFLARIGVGVGEACTGPSTFSMLADLFPRDKLPRALAVLNFGFTTGNGLALIIGGTVIAILAAAPPLALPGFGELATWQTTLLIVGLPGLVVAGLAFTLPEPVRRGIDRAAAGGDVPSVREVARYVFTYRAAYGLMIVAIALKTVLAFGQQAWGPVFYIRTFGWSPVDYGLIQGTIILVLGPLGAVFGSRLAERLYARGHDDANMRVVFYSSYFVVPLSILFPLMPSAELAVAVGALNFFCAAWVLGPQNAAIQVITPNRMRGQVTALFLFAFNIIGFGLGPLVVPLLTDFVFRDEALIGYSLATAAAVLGPLAMIVIWMSLKPYGERLAAAREWED